MLEGDIVFLRPVEQEDAIRLMLWENNPEHWKASNTEVPFSLVAIQQLIEQQQQIRVTGQLRLMICFKANKEAIGAIDLYDVDFKNKNASVGILIGEAAHRGEGHASEALRLLINYASKVLDLYNLHCSVQSDNSKSIKLFERNGFHKVGIRTEWFLFDSQRIDELIYQLCLKK